MAPAFKKAALGLVEEHNVVVAAVDCGDNEQLCQREQIGAYPTIRLLMPKGNGFDGSVETFQQKGPTVEAEELVEYVVSSLKNEVIVVKGPSDFKKRALQGITSYSAASKYQEKQSKAQQPLDATQGSQNASVWLINFSTNNGFNCPPCQHMKSLFKGMASSRFGSAAGRPLVNFGTVDCEVARSLCQEQDIHYFPQLRLYTLKGAVKHYMGSGGNEGKPYRGVPLVIDPQQAMHFPPGAALDVTAALLEALLPERPAASESSSATTTEDNADATTHNNDDEL